MSKLNFAKLHTRTLRSLSDVYIREFDAEGKRVDAL